MHLVKTQQPPGPGAGLRALSSVHYPRGRPGSAVVLLHVRRESFPESFLQLCSSFSKCFRLFQMFAFPSELNPQLCALKSCRDVGWGCSDHRPGQGALTAPKTVPRLPRDCGGLCTGSGLTALGSALPVQVLPIFGHVYP